MTSVGRTGEPEPHATWLRPHLGTAQQRADVLRRRPTPSAAARRPAAVRTGRAAGRIDPGFGDDALVTSDVATLVAWHCGRLSLGQAQRAGMQVVATPADERMLDAWGRLSPFAGVSPAVAR